MELDYEAATRRDYTNGSEAERLRLERMEPGIVGLYEHGKSFKPWPSDEADQLRRIARRILWDPQHPADHHGDFSRLARENCAVCVLTGKGTKDGPNWSGWHRVYVQAGAMIPDHWRGSFAALLDEHTPYADALGRDVATFGLMDGHGLVRPEPWRGR